MRVGARRSYNSLVLRVLTQRVLTRPVSPSALAVNEKGLGTIERVLTTPARMLFAKNTPMFAVMIVFLFLPLVASATLLFSLSAGRLGKQ
jgi:hypothetical protein